MAWKISVAERHLVHGVAAAIGHLIELQIDWRLTAAIIAVFVLVLVIRIGAGENLAVVDLRAREVVRGCVFRESASCRLLGRVAALVVEVLPERLDLQQILLRIKLGHLRYRLVVNAHKIVVVVEGRVVLLHYVNVHNVDAPVGARVRLLLLLQHLNLGNARCVIAIHSDRLFEARWESARIRCQLLLLLLLLCNDTVDNLLVLHECGADLRGQLLSDLAGHLRGSNGFFGGGIFVLGVRLVAERIRALSDKLVGRGRWLVLSGRHWLPAKLLCRVDLRLVAAAVFVGGTLIDERKLDLPKYLVIQYLSLLLQLLDLGEIEVLLLTRVYLHLRDGLLLPPGVRARHE